MDLRFWSNVAGVEPKAVDFLSVSLGTSLARLVLDFLSVVEKVKIPFGIRTHDLCNGLQDHNALQEPESFLCRLYMPDIEQEIIFNF